MEFIYVLARWGWVLFSLGPCSYYPPHLGAGGVRLLLSKFYGLCTYIFKEGYSPSFSFPLFLFFSGCQCRRIGVLSFFFFLFFPLSFPSPLLEWAMSDIKCTLTFYYGFFFFPDLVLGRVYLFHAFKGH